MKQRVAVETEIDTNGQWCGSCRFRSDILIGGPGCLCLIYGGCRLDRVSQEVEVDGEHWTHYENRRCAACLAATEEHMLMTNTQYAAWLVAEQGYREVPGGNGSTVLARPLYDEPEDNEDDFPWSQCYTDQDGGM